MKRLQEETGVKMSILGKGSMRDKEKVWILNTARHDSDQIETIYKKYITTWNSTSVCCAEKYPESAALTEINKTSAEVIAFSWHIQHMQENRRGFNNTFCNSQL